jgi:hypothetical protein
MIMDELTFTINLSFLLSWWVGGTLSVLFIISVFAGSWPDNPPAPAGDMMRVICGLLLVAWVIGRVIW